MKLTPWFSGRIKPVRDGVYMRKLTRSGHLVYAKFRGGVWYTGMSIYTPDARGYAVDSPYRSAMQSAKWLGVEKPRSRKGRKPVNT